MKKHGISILLVLILLAGAGLMLYPVVSDYINQLSQSKAIQDYNQSADTLNAELYDEMFQNARAFNEKLFQRGSISQLSEDDLQEYWSLMNLKNDGIIGYVHIPKIKLNLTIGHTVAEEVLRTKAGHLPESSFPIDGENVHAVLSAHRGLPSARLFTDLDEMEVGDTFQIHILNRIFTYQVVDVLIILPEETEYLNIVPGKNYATLMTCTPYGINTHRLLIRGEMTSQSRIGEDQEEPQKTLKSFLDENKEWLLPGAIAVLLLLFLMVLLLKRRSRK